MAVEITFQGLLISEVTSPLCQSYSSGRVGRGASGVHRVVADLSNFPE